MVIITDMKIMAVMVIMPVMHIMALMATLTVKAACNGSNGNNDCDGCNIYKCSYTGCYDNLYNNGERVRVYVCVYMRMRVTDFFCITVNRRVSKTSKKIVYEQIF